MAFTISESIDVIRLIEWICQIPDHAGETVIGDDALNAALRLNDKAHKTLGAGPRNEDIAAKWPAVRPHRGSQQQRRAAKRKAAAR